MRIDIATLFPDICETYLGQSIVGRARNKGVFELYCHQIRDYAFDKHHRVDDTPYSERQGMLLLAEPIYQCYKAVAGERKPHVIYMSPRGKVLNQQRLKELAEAQEDLFILCGHYEGVDQRVLDILEAEEISIGDYVLTGGELPAMILADGVVRLLDGTLSQADCFIDESHYSGLLEYPQYTKPQVWEGMAVPDILISGHHANILKWRREKSLEETYLKRPELLETAPLSDYDRAYLSELQARYEAMPEFLKDK